MVRRLFDGEVDTQYHQAYVYSGGTSGVLEDPVNAASAGQANGLCGGAAPGFLFFTTGLQSGRVGFVVEAHDEEPALDDAWEDVVEVSFTPATADITLVEWGGEPVSSLDLEVVSLRARYCARGMDRASEAGRRSDDEPMLDRYLLQFWAQPPAPDRIVKETSGSAAYWHAAARRRTPAPEEVAAPPAPLHVDDVFDRVLWGDNPPSERVRRSGGNVVGLGRIDRPLLDALAEADEGLQRAVARWAARRAYDEAGLSDLDWVAPALAALERGEALPAPFDEPAQVWHRVLTDESVPNTVVRPTGGGPADVSRQAMAVPALFGAAQADPLRATVDALYAAAVSYGDEYPLFLAEVRGAFPTLVRL